MGIILSFAIPSVAKIIEDSKEKSFQNQLKFIEKAGEQYLLQNETELEWEEHPSNPEEKIAIIPLGRLQTEGSIQSPINNPKGGIFDPDETKILVTKLGLNQTVQVLTRGAVTPEFCFEFNEQTQTIMNYRNENPLCTSDVVIPSTKNGVEVKIINDTAFGSKNLTSVIIPNTVEIIGLAAF